MNNTITRYLTVAAIFMVATIVVGIGTLGATTTQPVFAYQNTPGQDTHKDKGVVQRDNGDNGNGNSNTNTGQQNDQGQLISGIDNNAS
jgi:hypothetical protein